MFVLRQQWPIIHLQSQLPLIVQLTQITMNVRLHSLKAMHLTLRMLLYIKQPWRIMIIMHNVSQLVALLQAQATPVANLQRHSITISLLF